jgi:hypothetical protein
MICDPIYLTCLLSVALAYWGVLCVALDQCMIHVLKREEPLRLVRKLEVYAISFYICMYVYYSSSEQAFWDPVNASQFETIVSSLMLYVLVSMSKWLCIREAIGFWLAQFESPSFLCWLLSVCLWIFSIYQTSKFFYDLERRTTPPTLLISSEVRMGGRKHGPGA